MKSVKFDESDRGKVIAEVESHFGVTLSRVGKFHKFLKDASGKSYWVLGGYEYWHGVPSEMLEAEKQDPTDGVLIVAKRWPKAIDIFFGELQPMVVNERALCHTQTGDFQFNIFIRGNLMTVKEIPSLVLHKLGPRHQAELPVAAVLKKMTQAQRDRLFKAILEKQKPS